MKTTAQPRILVTGASGLLGRPVLRAFALVRGWNVTGAAFQRAGPGLECVDLSQPDRIPAFLDRLSPSVIIHSAAERRPDVSERDPEGTQRLNVDATSVIAHWAAQHDAFMIYLSTDYVFDGTCAPYRPDDTPHPLNTYGMSKLAGEGSVLTAGGPAAILRVPILYGQVETLKESAVTVIAETLLASIPGDGIAMDHWAIRYPTHTDDVAVVLRQMVAHKLDHPGFSGIYHWSGNQPMTKYEMALAFAEALRIDPSRLVPKTTPAPGAPRPKDCHLDTSALERLGIGQQTDFAKALPGILAPHLR